ncbi:MAG: Glu-tRNA(Gln) amidotransferase subunit GatE [Candidatus Thalassarchaeaceae archaeon]|nr:Glu-tRNA(Gln) amidotransferase subunit GatE [Candidatus Thalassarchaeaceae archaeon]
MGAEPIGFVDDANSLDPKTLGFMCGLEIHQQLNSGKLHSRQPSILFEMGIESIPSNWNRVERRLSATSGESGSIDVAARFEQRRKRSFVYIQCPNSGLIELDDAPPSGLDDDALDIAMTISTLLEMHPVDILQTMRKQVVDGSNTSGFQRTTLIGTSGKVSTKGGDVGIDVLLLEEDSARKLESRSTDQGEQVVYILDRLGIPLVEIATAPDIIDPDHAMETARTLGNLLRSTRSVRRGLGTIRQDLNVSIACGDRVEIKGTQDLDWVPRIIRLEMARQIHFYRLANELRAADNLPKLPPNREDDDNEIEEQVRVFVEKKFPFEPQDVTDEFATCDSSMIQRTISSDGSIIGVSLPDLANSIGIKALDNEGSQLPRLGRELAGAAKLAGVAGIFHSDELPAYGITQGIVDAVRSKMGLNEEDGFVLCAAPEWQAMLALESVIDRVRLAYHRIPKEVRNVIIRKGAPEDGTTSPMRPLPGSARMYPETDVPVRLIQDKDWERVLSNMPPSAEERLAKLQPLGLSENQIEALLGGELDDLVHDPFNDGSPLPEGVSAKAWTSLLLDRTVNEVAENAKMEPSDVPYSLLCIGLYCREIGNMTREGLIPLSSKALKQGVWPTERDVMMAWFTTTAEEDGFKPADASSIEAIVDEILAERADFIAERGMGAMGPLMGVILERLGNGADGKAVSAILRDRLS